MYLPILYQDQDLVVINKPSGLLVHRSQLDKNATQFAMQILRDQIGRMVYPVHRLDRSTSGALIFALSKEVARKIANEFYLGNIEKKYLAVVRGHFGPQKKIDYALKEEIDKFADIGVSPDKPAQSAVTVISMLGHCELPICVDKFPTARYSLVKAQPLTGRKHQIRRHLRHSGHPIIGDINYGVGKHNKFFEENYKIRRLLLACVEVSFYHPTRHNLLTIKSPLAPDFCELIKKLGWADFAN